MSTLKKILALSLALAMILSVSVFAGNYSADTYKDAAAIDKDAAESVELLYALKIMTGDEKGNFNPNATITRAEVAKMIYVILNKGNDDKAVNYAAANLFTDVPSTAWYAGYINYLAALGLVNGSEGKFYPTNPVKTAEAAKMLLTAIGYSATDRQYTGANWAKNVLSDASIVGLLAGYEADINGAAPRQWVAVMFANALLNAYTFDTVVPSGFNGIFGTGSAVAGTNKFIKFGYKYYGLETFTGYLFATDSVYIDVLKDGQRTKKDDNNKTVQVREAASGRVIFAEGTEAEEGEWIQVKNPGLGYMDLGQQFRVIYKSNGSVYSARATGKSAIGDSTVYDLTYDIVRATSKNEAYNRYEFTAGEFTGTFDKTSVNELVVDKKDSSTKFDTISYGNMARLAGQRKADDVRVIDRDGDGDIDYVIYKAYTYAQVESVKEHKIYGEYFTADDVQGNSLKAVGFKAINNNNNDTTQWYLDDVVNTDDEIEANNILKICYNPDEAKYDVEVMAVESDVAYEKRSSKGIHTLGGEDYVVGAAGWETANNKVLVASNLKEKMNLVAEDGLVILAQLVDSNYDDLADINAQLVMVTGLQIDKYNVGSNRVFIDYMTIDGEEHEEVRVNIGKCKIGQEDNATAENVETLLENTLKADKRLFVLRETGDQVYLTSLTAANAQKVLSYSDSLLDGYREEGYATGDAKKFDAAKATFDDDYINDENVFFMSYLKNGSRKYLVGTLDELGAATYNQGHIQGLYTTKRTIDTYQAGYIGLGELSLKQASGYLYTTSGDTWSEDSDEDTFVLGDVVFEDGETAESIVVAYDNTLKSDDIQANCLYSYTYEKVKGEPVYTLTLIDEMSQKDNIDSKGYGLYNRVDLFPGKKTSGMTDKYDIVTVTGKTILARADGAVDETVTVNSDTVVVLKKMTWNPDTTYVSHDDALKLEDEEIAFVTFADLIAEEDDEYVNFIAGGEDDTYKYYSDYIVVGSYKGAEGKADMLYVIVHAVADDANN